MTQHGHGRECGPLPSLWDLLSSGLTSAPEAEVREEARVVAFAELASQVEVASRRLQSAVAEAAADLHTRPPLLGLHLAQGIEYTTLVLAAIHARLPFVPLDPSWPAPHHEAILEAAQPTLVITSSTQVPPDHTLAPRTDHVITSSAQPSLPAAPDHVMEVPGSTAAQRGPRVLQAAQLLGTCPSKHNAWPSREPGTQQQHPSSTLAAACPDVTSGKPSVAPAGAPYLYVLFTSGSTGTPMGVCGTEQGLVNRILWMQAHYPLYKGDVVAVKTAVSFVDHLWETLAPIAAGAHMTVMPTQLRAHPAAWPAWLTEHSITHLVSVPSLLGLLAPALHQQKQQGQLSQLRLLVSSGELLSQDLSQQLLAALPDNCCLLNLYGSTEVAADCTCYDITASQRTHIQNKQPVRNSSQQDTAAAMGTADREVADGSATWLPAGTPLHNTAIFILPPLPDRDTPATGIHATTDSATDTPAGDSAAVTSMSALETFPGAQCHSRPPAVGTSTPSAASACMAGQTGTAAPAGVQVAQPCTWGALGEVCVAGLGVAAGYIHAPGHTTLRFPRVRVAADSLHRVLFGSCSTPTPVASITTHTYNATVPATLKPTSVDDSAVLLAAGWGSGLPAQQHARPGDPPHSGLAASAPVSLGPGSDSWLAAALTSSQGIHVFRTGDLGCITPAGQLMVVGRLDHQVKVDGVRVDLVAVEQCITQSHFVTEAAAVMAPRVFLHPTPGSQPHHHSLPGGLHQNTSTPASTVTGTATQAVTRPAGPQVLTVFVVAADGAPCAAADLPKHCALPLLALHPLVRHVRGWVAQRMPAAAVPGVVVVVPTLPRNPAGKLLRPQLLQLLPSPATSTTGYVTTQAARSGTDTLLTGDHQTGTAPPAAQVPHMGAVPQAVQPGDRTDSVPPATGAVPAALAVRRPVTEATVMRVVVAALGDPRLEPRDDYVDAGLTSLQAAGVAGALACEPALVLAARSVRTLAGLLRGDNMQGAAGSVSGAAARTTGANGGAGASDGGGGPQTVVGGGGGEAQHGRPVKRARQLPPLLQAPSMPLSQLQAAHPMSDPSPMSGSGNPFAVLNELLATPGTQLTVCTSRGRCTYTLDTGSGWLTWKACPDVDDAHGTGSNRLPDDFGGGWQLKVAWNQPLGRCIDASPVLINVQGPSTDVSATVRSQRGAENAVSCVSLDLVVAASHDGQVAAFVQESGQCVWLTHLPTRVEVAVAVCPVCVPLPSGPDGGHSMSAHPGGGHLSPGRCAPKQKGTALGAGAVSGTQGDGVASQSSSVIGQGDSVTSQVDDVTKQGPAGAVRAAVCTGPPAVVLAVAGGDGTLYSQDLRSGQVVGSCQLGGEPRSPPVLDPWCSSRAWVTTHGRALVGVDMTCCQVVCKEPLPAASSVSPVFSLARQCVLVACLDGSLCCWRYKTPLAADHHHTGRPTQGPPPAYSTPCSTLSPPAPGVAISLTGSSGENSVTLSFLWHVGGSNGGSVAPPAQRSGLADSARDPPKRAPPVFSSPVVVEDQDAVVVAHVDGRVRCVDLDSGRQRWEVTLDGHVYAGLQPLHAQQMTSLRSHQVARSAAHTSSGGEQSVLVATHGGSIWCLDATTGSTVWCYSVGYGKMSCMPVVKKLQSHVGAEGLLLAVASCCGVLSVLRVLPDSRDRGSEGPEWEISALSEVTLPGELYSNPVLHVSHCGGAPPTIGLYLGCRDDQLYSLRLQADTQQ